MSISEVITKTIVTVVVGISVTVMITAILTIPTWLLWNWLIPQIFGLQKITIFQSLGITLLTSILFKSSSSK